MQNVPLGSQGLVVARIRASAAWACPSSTAHADDAESIATIHRALELGVTLLDTADMYGPYTNEELVGRAIAGPPRRGRARHEVRHRPRRGRAASRGVDGSAAVRPQRASRARCGASASTTIDLYYQHRVDPATPIEETVGAMAELVAGGQGPLPRAVRGRARTRSAARTPCTRSRALQTEYSLWTRDPEDERAADAARARHRLRALPPARPRLPDRRDPLARRARRRRLPAQQPALQRREPRRRTCGIVDKVERARGARRAPRRRRSRWRGCSRRATTSSPIPGTKRRRCLEENVGGARRRAGAPTSSPASTRSAPARRPLRGHDESQPLVEGKARVGGQRWWRTTWAARSAQLRVSVRKWCGPRGFRDHGRAARRAHSRVPARGRCGPRTFGDGKTRPTRRARRRCARSTPSRSTGSRRRARPARPRPARAGSRRRRC